MAQLQAQAQKAGLSDKVRLLLVSYDPEFDTPRVLNRYAQAHGTHCNGGMMLLRLDPKDKRRLFEELEVAVNFNSSGVNIHGLQLFLFDKQARLARQYRTWIWDNDAVLADLKQLTEEN